MIPAKEEGMFLSIFLYVLLLLTRDVYSTHTSDSGSVNGTIGCFRMTVFVIYKTGIFVGLLYTFLV